VTVEQSVASMRGFFYVAAGYVIGVTVSYYAYSYYAGGNVSLGGVQVGPPPPPPGHDG
jgi:hypothetical protein